MTRTDYVLVNRYGEVRYTLDDRQRAFERAEELGLEVRLQVTKITLQRIDRSGRFVRTVEEVRV